MLGQRSGLHMPLARRWGIAFVLAAILSFASAASAFAGWDSVRDRAMTLREQGKAMDAYSAVAGFQGASGEDKFDHDFVAGWLALRGLKRPDVALRHFKEMAAATAGLRKERAGPGKAKAGYWLGRALKDLGKAAEAKSMFDASMSYSTTFYGQLSASELRKPVTKAQIERNAANYPVKDLYWYDNRAKLELVLAVIREESRFSQDAVSSAKARGMMQVMDGTAMHVGKTAGVNVDIRLMRTNADYNIAVGSRYLADQLDRYNGNPMLAAAAYNAGPVRIDEWLQRFGDPRGGGVDPVDWAESIPFGETRAYVQKVIASYITYLALRG